ncbi:hypothetical protein QTP86_008233 [Hemibagrus guttatus]|nr:hypothetical protein QTP86_008233 [Hemibagrus guttatus]
MLRVKTWTRTMMKQKMALSKHYTRSILKLEHLRSYDYFWLDIWFCGCFFFIPTILLDTGMFQPKREVNCKGEADVRSVHDEPEGDASEETAGDEELVEFPECKTPEKMPPPAVDPMRTPQLSDFGLSALHLQMLCNPDRSQDVAPVPAVALTPPSLLKTMCEFQPKTPKCTLSMDEEALTPRLEDFGITESTMCFNNDFTMDLFRKKPPKDKQNNSTTQQLTPREPHNLPEAPSCVSLGRLSGDSMKSPEMPVLSTLEIKMNKLGQSCSLPNGGSDPESLSQPSAATATPELPTFETPYLSKLISARKETKQNDGSLESTSHPAEDPSVRGPSSESPQMPVSFSQMEELTPEMPRLQSFFSSTLPCTGTGKQSGVTEPPVPALQADEHTQDWCLATPCNHMEFDVEPRTPEMPDMSSVTQDIFKLMAQANNKQPTTTSVQTSSKASLNTLAPGKENSESNSEEFHMEELRKILDVGPQAPMYILCLVELKRLENVQGFGRNASFKVLTKA